MKFGKRLDNVTDRRMRKYRLTRAAKEDIVGIAQYGDEHFGVAQSNRYRDQLKHRFTVLADHPFQYPAVDHIRNGYRRSVCGAHSIYFRVDGENVEIVRILKSQDPEKQL